MCSYRPKKGEVMGWHFIREDYKTSFPNPIPNYPTPLYPRKVKAGDVLRVKQPVRLCALIKSQ